MRAVAILLTMILMGGCTFMQRDFANYGRNYNKVELNLLTIGDDKEQVVSKIGEPENVIDQRDLKKALLKYGRMKSGMPKWATTK